MGYNPQLKVKEPIPLEFVEAILIPEHLWPAAEKIMAFRSELNGLACKLKSGETQADYLAGRKNVARRGRGGGGGFEPNMGFNALRKLEEAYFRLVAGCHPLQYNIRKVVEMGGDRALWSPSSPGWIQITADPAKPPLKRNKDGDWKIFVNPREENFFAALGIVLEVRAEFPEGIDFNIPRNLLAEWREGRRFTASNSPKIVIWLNQETVSQILERLSERLNEQFPDGIGFGEDPGPSFANPYYGRDLFYKREYDIGDGITDPRVSIARPIEIEGRRSGKSLVEIREEQIAALEAAGYEPPYFHRKISDPDPTSF
jgi:hypothetical protein